MSIHVQTTSGIQQHIIVEVSAVIDEERDEQVFQMTDTLVDYQNATITEIVLDREHLVALVNLSSVNRLVMVNLSSGEQQILVIQYSL